MYDRISYRVVNVSATKDTKDLEELLNVNAERGWRAVHIDLNPSRGPAIVVLERCEEKMTMT